MLHFCDRLLSSDKVVPVRLAFESEFFQVLADFIKARKAHGGRALPHVTICNRIGTIVCCTWRTAHLQFDKRWSEEKIFKKFAASGMLEQILRCSTVLQQELLESDICGRPDCFYLLLQTLESCTSILTRRFKSGEPCGDTLKAILDGRDGSRNIRPNILNQLQGIDRLVESMDVTEYKAKLTCTCFYCDKKGDAEAPLSCCSRCRFSYYCSKECQKADWKTHKLHCQKISKPERDRVITRNMITRRFMDQNSETVFQAMVKKCESTGLEPSDLAVEVDFMPNEDDIIPAFHHPPIFRTVLIQDYISGQDMPTWLRRREKFEDQDGFRVWFCNEVKQMKTQDRITSGALVMRHAGYVHIDCELILQYREADI